MEKGEKTLVKRAMRGNPKAFGTLVEREQEYLYRMAFLYVRQGAGRPGRGAGEHPKGL